MESATFPLSDGYAKNLQDHSSSEINDYDRFDSNSFEFRAIKFAFGLQPESYLGDCGTLFKREFDNPEVVGIDDA